MLILIIYARFPKLRSTVCYENMVPQLGSFLYFLFTDQKTCCNVEIIFELLFYSQNTFNMYKHGPFVNFLVLYFYDSMS